MIWWSTDLKVNMIENSCSISNYIFICTFIKWFNWSLQLNRDQSVNRNYPATLTFVNEVMSEVTLESLNNYHSRKRASCRLVDGIIIKLSQVFYCYARDIIIYDAVNKNRSDILITNVFHLTKDFAQCLSLSRESYFTVWIWPI